MSLFSGSCLTPILPAYLPHWLADCPCHKPRSACSNLIKWKKYLLAVVLKQNLVPSWRYYIESLKVEGNLVKAILHNNETGNKFPYLFQYSPSSICMTYVDNIRLIWFDWFWGRIHLFKQYPIHLTFGHKASFQGSNGNWIDDDGVMEIQIICSREVYVLWKFLIE